MKNVLAACVLFTLGISLAVGQNAANYIGVWSVRMDTQTFAVVTLSKRKAGLVGNITLPEHFSTNGLTLTNIEGPVQVNSVNVAVVDGSNLHLTTQGSNPTDKDEWIMTLPVGGVSSLRLAAMPMVAWPMRSDVNAKVSQVWDKNRTYSFLESSVSSPIMTKIFSEDQRVLVGVTMTHEYASKIALGQRQRREQVLDLLKKGDLHSGLDFERAAFIFQHGETSQDFLLAHALALAALARGQESASWIASVSLDRYLLAIGQPQIFGTQMNFGTDTSLRKPYDNALIPEVLRKQLGLQTSQDEEKQIKLLAQPGFISKP